MSCFFVKNNIICFVDVEGNFREVEILDVNQPIKFYSINTPHLLSSNL